MQCSVLSSIISGMLTCTDRNKTQETHFHVKTRERAIKPPSYETRTFGSQKFTCS